MKKRILTLGMVLVLAAVLVAPGAVLATTTDVTGDVIEGYTFTAPLAVVLGDMDPSATPSTGSSTGWLQGNNALGYTVKGIDSTGTPAGYMTEPVGPTDLTNMLQMGPDVGVAYTAATETIFLTTTGITNEAVPFYVSQTVEFTDPIATGYTITITFTVAQNT